MVEPQKKSIEFFFPVFGFFSIKRRKLSYLNVYTKEMSVKCLLGNQFVDAWEFIKLFEFKSKHRLSEEDEEEEINTSIRLRSDFFKKRIEIDLTETKFNEIPSFLFANVRKRKKQNSNYFHIMVINRHSGSRSYLTHGR